MNNQYTRFTEYMVDVKGWDDTQVQEAINEMEENGALIADYLTQKELQEFKEYTN